MSLLTLPEQRAARKALERLEVHLSQRRLKPKISPFAPVFLHGLPGTGKSALLRQLVDHAGTLDPGLIARMLPARELAEMLRDDAEAEAIRTELRGSDMLVVEDLQFLPAFAAEPLAVIVDDVVQRKGYFLASAAVGPMALPNLGGRLESRLAAGLALRLDSLAEESRRRFTVQRLKLRKLAVEPDLLDFLSGQPGELREAVGRVAQLETLARILPVPLRLSDVSPHFPQIPQPAGSSIAAIVQKLAKNMGQDVKALKSPARYAGLAWARQVAMYVVRTATGKPLKEIGGYFGGRDHTTVIHALAKVEQRMRDDPTIRREIERWVREAT